LAAAGEVTMGDMVLVDLRTGRSHELLFKNFTMNSLEFQNFVPESIKWLSPSVCQLRLVVTCNPFEVGENCDTKKVVREESVRVDLNSLKIDYFPPAVGLVERR
jgi:hypothetical protein